MLINKTQEVASIRYNGRIISVTPNAKLDVRDFDVANKDVRGCEKHIMNKNPGIFEITDDRNDGNVSKELQNEIKELNSKLVDEQKKSAELKLALDNISEKHAASVGEIEGAKQETKNIKKELVKIKKENEDLEDEVTKLRLSVTTGKK